MAAAPGNQYRAKERIWKGAIERALEKRSRVDQVQALDVIAEKLLEACESGEQWAIKELGDRLDGKPGQQIDLGNKDGQALILKFLQADDAL
jgi:hypothetical protein